MDRESLPVGVLMLPLGRLDQQAATRAFSSVESTLERVAEAVGDWVEAFALFSRNVDRMAWRDPRSPVYLELALGCHLSARANELGTPRELLRAQVAEACEALGARLSPLI